MNIDMILESGPNACFDSLTYRTLCGLLPAVSELHLPNLKTVQAGHYDGSIFYSGSAVDGEVTIFRQGFYLYKERAASTVCSVSTAGSVMNENYTSATEDPALELDKLLDLPWYWPLTIAGKVRLELNRSKHDDKAAKRYMEKRRDQGLESMTPDFAAQDITVTEEAERERDLLIRLNTAVRDLTDKEQRVLWMYICQNQERTHVAQKLHIQPVTVSNTKRRGIVKLRTALTQRNAT